jgi:hypothetical protein
MKKIILAFSLIAVFDSAYAQPGHISLGAYYFNGWTAPTDYHITKELASNYPERTPKWGWVTGTPQAMKEQIDLAADAGLSFFAFCWFYPTANKANFRNDPLNQALNYYLQAPNQNRLKFCIQATNHNGFIIGPEDWETVTDEWVKFFQNSQYITVDGKPLLVVFSLQTLVDKFGSDAAVKSAFEVLRQKATRAGLKGVSIAVNIPANSGNVGQAENCGVDIFTGYNLHTAGFKPGDVSAQNTEPVSNLISGSEKNWDFFTKYPVPLIPCVTLNWDPRPWVSQGAFYANSPRYTGYNAVSVYNSIVSVRRWIHDHPNNTTKEKVALIYAWNEYGEGAWLTPTATSNALLDAVKSSLERK